MFSPRSMEVYTTSSLLPSASSITFTGPLYNQTQRLSDLFSAPLKPLSPLASSATSSNITKLTFDSRVEQCIESFPPSLSHLTFSHYNWPLDNLPPFLTHLSIEGGFNQAIKINDLPPSLLSLTISSPFTHPLNFLPSSLTHLTFKPRLGYHRPLDELPVSLTHLVLDCGFMGPLSFPPSLLSLHLSGKDPTSFANLPDSLTSLHIFSCSDAIQKLPHSLLSLSFHHCFVQLPPLPSSLTSLTYGSEYNFPILDLPPSLTHLTFSIHFNQPISNLPPSLVQVSFGIDFDQPIDALPMSLRSLSIISRKFSHPLTFPSSLISLTLRIDEYHITLPHLPPSLRELHLFLTNNYSYPSPPLPSSITSLYVWSPDIFSSLPSSLQQFRFFSASRPLPPLPDSLLFLQLPPLFTLPLPNFPPLLYKIRASKKYPHLKSIPKRIEVDT